VTGFRSGGSCLGVTWLVVLATGLAADAPVRLRPAGIDGTLVICGDGPPSAAAWNGFAKLAGGEKARIVVLLADSATEPPAAHGQARFDAMPVGNDGLSDKQMDVLANTTAVWVVGDLPRPVLATLPTSALGRAIRDLVAKRGALGGQVAPLVDSLDLLPGTVLTPHGDLAAGRLGFQVGRGAALVVHGRQLSALGTGPVTASLAKTATRDVRTVDLRSRECGDLTALRRAAIARAEPPFPPTQVGVPEVTAGTLLIGGGGGMPPEVMTKFVELAGGPDAPIVVLPTAHDDPKNANGELALVTNAGAKNAKLLPATELKSVESPQMLATLEKARGIWFGGGRQWRFVDAYDGTKALETMRGVLRRGGVIGGSSAGATIQGDYLCRGSPFSNREMMSEGYERGFGFLPGTAIDQHFAQRNRFADMTRLLTAHPQLLGIGIDEGTALIVRGHVAEVMGRGQAHIYDRQLPQASGAKDYVSFKPGERCELRARVRASNEP
jgi:cyanophycinase